MLAGPWEGWAAGAARSSLTFRSPAGATGAHTPGGERGRRGPGGRVERAGEAACVCGGGGGVAAQAAGGALCVALDDSCHGLGVGVGGGCAVGYRDTEVAHQDHMEDVRRTILGISEYVQVRPTRRQAVRRCLALFAAARRWQGRRARGWAVASADEGRVTGWKLEGPGDGKHFQPRTARRARLPAPLTPDRHAAASPRSSGPPARPPDTLGVRTTPQVVSGSQKYLQRRLDRHKSTLVRAWDAFASAWAPRRGTRPTPIGALPAAPNLSRATAATKCTCQRARVARSRRRPVIAGVLCVPVRVPACRRATTGGRSGTRCSRCWPCWPSRACRSSPSCTFSSRAASSSACEARAPPACCPVLAAVRGCPDACV